MTGVEVVVQLIDALSCEELVGLLSARGLPVLVVGDARRPRDVSSAIVEAARSLDDLARRSQEGPFAKSG